MPAVSVTVSVPVKVPTCVGVKVTVIVQVAYAASPLPQLLVCLNMLEPEIAILLTPAKIPLVFVIVMVALGLSPTT